jgi:DNA mismatch repair protein MutL
MTLGFRGEAVASIASISKMTITSKTENGKCYSLSCNGGDIGRITETSGEKGTDVRVEMLFYNTPVRLSFLKSEKAEETEITNFVSRFILNRSDIAFTYYVNGKKVLQSFGGGDEEAMVCVYGAAVLSECFCIDAVKHGIRIRGYIGDHNFFKANKSYQNIFLNGRYIVNSTVSAAISNAYASYLMKRQYPFYVLHIDVPTEIVDVNVHPNKSDVRFADNQIIYGCIYSVISSILDGQTKALEYVVKTPTHAPSYEDTIPTPKVQESKTTEKENTQNNNGFATLTYEEAKKEIEQNTPLRAKRLDDLELPFEEAESKPETVEERKKPIFPKGFIPKEMIGPYVPKPSLGPIEHSTTARDTGAEELHKRFPDLYFKEVFLEVNDPQKEEAESRKAEEEDAFAANKRFLEEEERKKKQNRIDVSNCVYAGKLFNTYLMYELGDAVYIIDQHAAHERLIYNRLKAQMDARAIVRQPMLLPFELRLNPTEGAFIREHLNEILDLGFTIEESEENCFAITEIPVDLQNINLTAFFNDILADIDGYKSIKLADILKDKLASAACKAAVKGGMDLTREEIDALFALMDGDMGLKCPHGRPVVVKLTKTELEKMFKRIV